MQYLGLVTIDKAGSGLEEAPGGDGFCSQGAERGDYRVVCGVSMGTGRGVTTTGTHTCSVWEGHEWGETEAFPEVVPV